MKNFKIKPLILASIIMMSFIVATVTIFEDIPTKCELCEKSNGEEDKSEEKKSEDFHQEYMLNSSFTIASNHQKKSFYSNYKNHLPDNNGDVLTPPPEFI